MEPIDFDESNMTFTRPADMTDDQCGSLKVWQGHEQSTGFPLIISKWKLSAEDLKRVNETGEVWLSIYGSGMPPVSIFTENPFNNVQNVSEGSEG